MNDMVESLEVERRPHRRTLTTGGVLVLGVFSIAMLAWTDLINNRTDDSFWLADAIMDLQINVAASHLELEEGSDGGRPVRADHARIHLDQSAALCATMLDGSDLENGRTISQLYDPGLRVKLQDISRMLADLQSIISRHYLNPETDESPQYWDVRYDAAYAELMKAARDVEIAIERRLLEDHAESRRLFYGIFLAWVCVVVVSTSGLYSQERHRRAAETALIKANIDLERQAGELHSHRERLTELVEERTRSLRAANSDLQTEIAERRLAEEALRTSEEKYRMLVETMNEGLAILDREGSFTYVNDRLCSMFGRSRAELLGRRCADFARTESDRVLVEEHLRDIGRYEHDRVEVAFRTNDGRDILTMVSPKGTYDPGGNMSGCFAIITDVTEKVTLQAKSLRAAHLASLGELAAGVAHEINNPINGIINYARMLCERGNVGSQEHDIAGRIHTEGRRVADIVRGLLLFARGGNREKIPVTVKEILSNAFGLIGSQLKKDGIEILTAIPDDIPTLIADPQELQQVFMNVLSNARHALNQKYPGRDPGKILQITVAALNGKGMPYQRISFQDSGTGISRDLIEKVKEPFFSTKPKGRGTGLGLSISNGIINEHGGTLSIESMEGEFTRVIIDLPAEGGYDGQSTGG